MQRRPNSSRRQFLGLAAGSAAALGALPVVIVRPAEATPAMLASAIQNVTGGAAVRSGKVKLDIPPLIDNGNTVPLSVAVESPMTEADHVKAIHVFTERNPQPYVLSVQLGPRAGRAQIATRARIGDTGAVTAIAQMSDGSFWSDSVKVIVTLSACLEEGLI
jgi:sulfur-oxidizing protein SoxY